GARARLPRGGPGAARPRSTAQRGEDTGPDRAGDQRNVRGDGAALWDRGGARATAQAEGQGEGGRRRADRAAVDRRVLAHPPLLQPGGAQRGDPGAAGEAQYEAVSEARRVP